jgi:hypothetical protein
MLQIALAALWDRPPLDLGQLQARASAKAWMTSAASVLTMQASTPLNQLPDDQLFAWATGIQMSVMNYFSAVASYNSFVSGPTYTPQLGMR